MKKILLIILDGFGLREDEHGNAVKKANMTYFNKLWEEYPHSTLESSGEAVGLPKGQFGNSEVCHEVIGLGKKIKQKITIINENIENREILNNENFNDMISHLETTGGTLHLMGLLSDGGVHSSITYMLKLIPLLKEKGIKKMVFHAITDGRDTGRKTSVKYLKQMEEVLKENNGIIGSICGRYYAMDRDNKWDRTEKYYNLVINGVGFNILNYETAINNLYRKNITDEFLPPMLVNGKNPINDNDALLWLNFRPDRARQILNAINNPDFKEFKTKNLSNFKSYMMFKQDDVVNVKHFFILANPDNLYPIGEYFSDLKLSQARVAETEKYNHVTYFFNAEKSKKFPMCTNYLIPSPNVATYDETPLMSAIDVTKQVKKCLENDFDFILVNYANPDMLGHTGNMDATVTSLRALDKILQTVVESAQDNFYTVMITADHGNCDIMIDDNGEIVTTHTTSPVPFILLDKKITLKEKGDLTNIAPTILKYMDIAIPKEMKESKDLILEDV